MALRLSKDQIKAVKDVYSRCLSTCKSLNPLNKEIIEQCATECDTQNKNFLRFSNATDVGVFISILFLILVIVWAFKK